MKRARWVFVLVSLLGLPLVSMLILANGDSAQGKAAFMKRCKMCHGADGQGNPAMARMLNVEFKAMDSKYVQDLSDDEIKTTILNGKGKMAAVRGTTETEIADIIAYLRTLKSDQE